MVPTAILDAAIGTSSQVKFDQRDISRVHCVIQGCLSTIILSIDKGEAECGRKGAKEGIGTGRAAVEGSAV